MRSKVLNSAKDSSTMSTKFKNFSEIQESILQKINETKNQRSHLKSSSQSNNIS